MIAVLGLAHAGSPMVGGQVVDALHDGHVVVPDGTRIRCGPGGTVAGAVAAAAVEVDHDGNRELVTCGPGVSGWEVPGWILPGPAPRGPAILGADPHLTSDGDEPWVASSTPTVGAEPPATTRVMMFRFPGFAGTGGTLASGRSPARSQVSTAVGVAMGSTLAPSRGIGGSPSFAMAFERRIPAGRFWWGFDTAPLLVQAGDSVVWHVALASSGVTFGGPHVRSGPYASLGLLGLGAGWRAVLAPFESRGGTLRGLEARITLIAGPSVDGPILWSAPTGSVSLMYVGTTQVGWHRGRDAPRDRTPPPTELRRGPFVCRQLSLGVGVAGGASSTRLSWEHIGADKRLEASYSAAFSAACETGAEPGGWFAAISSAPWFVHRIPWDDQRSDQIARHMGSATVGWVTGSSAVRLGPIATAGIWTLGGGARLLVAPFRNARGVRHGLELRAEILVPSAPSAEAMLLYTAAFDPRRGKIHER